MRARLSSCASSADFKQHSGGTVRGLVAAAVADATMRLDAKGFLRLVKETTPSETYERFKTSLTSFRHKDLTVAGFKNEIRDMFRPYPAIIDNFNKFMARYYRIAQAF